MEVDGKYPRVRGERVLADPSRESEVEIPPRARGTAPARRLRLSPWGNTPACAGNGHRLAARIAPEWKYPRVRGERNDSNIRVGGSSEIPPRARGTGSCSARRVACVGNTPACAGNGILDGLSAPWDGKYPRVRGEREVGGHDIDFGMEIPPRARGTGAVDWPANGTSGNTPACAGNG